MLYENCKIYGPYKRKDGRQHIVAIKDFIALKGCERKTISYPKYVMELHLGRYLEDDETVHHKDGNPLNNEISNLLIMKRKDHARQDAIKYTSEAFICPICKNEFILEGIKLRQFYSNKRNIKSKGPFCSRKCTGKYGKIIQMGV